MQCNLAVLIAAALVLGACTHSVRAPDASAPVVSAPASTYVADAMHADRLIVGGQPLALDLPALQAAGVKRIVNLRTPEEMQALDFDEAAQAQALGLQYLALPLGGKDYPYSPALVDALEAQLQGGDGQLLLHCASGGRAGLVYAAWLVKYRGMSPDAAMRSLESLGGWPLPLEKLLGRPLTVEFRQP